MGNLSNYIDDEIINCLGPYVYIYGKQADEQIIKCKNHVQCCFTIPCS